MTKNILLFFLLVSPSCLLFSQEKDTIFYTAEWTKTTKQYAQYFRPLPLEKRDSLFITKDYFIDGKLQMLALSSSNIKDIFEGKVTWYFKNGNIQYVRHYKNGKLVGQLTSYFEDGTPKSDGELLENGYYDGTIIKTCDCPYKVEKYENGALNKRFSYYQDTKTIAEKQVIKYYDQVQKSIYYDRKGNEIASVDYINRSGNYLEAKSGTIIHFSYTNDFFVKDIVAKTIISSENDIKKEVTYSNKNDIIATGILKDGFPFEGVFLKKGILKTYKNSERDGEERCCIDRDNIETLGIYKNNSAFSGSFYNPYRRIITSYENGRIQGEKKVFDTNFNIIKLENYSKGLLDGKRITQNKFSKKIHTSIYSEGKPKTGEVFDFENLEVYDNYKLIEKTIYDYKTGAPKEIISYDIPYNISNKVFLKDNKTYTLSFKNGAPFEGVELQPFGFVTYKNGKYEGPFVIYDKDQTIKGDYKNFKHDGLILFINTKTQDTLKCTFKDGKPIDGINAFSGKISYKNGLKHGLYAKNFNNSNFAFDSLSAYYKNDVKIDTIRYFKKRKQITLGVFKNGKPYNGHFYDDTRRQNFEVYNQGIITKKENIDYYNNYRHQFLYDAGKLTKENVFYLDYKKDSLTHKLIYKNNKPFLGSAFKKDSITKHFSFTNYINGKKEGFQTFHKKPFGVFTKKFTYKNDVLDGKVQYQYIYNKNEITEGVYKKNKPLDGEFVTEYRSYIEVAKYKKSKLQQKRFYTFSKFSDYQDAIDSITYKNNKPLNGLVINFNTEKKLFGKLYKNGTLIKTDLSPSLKPYRSYRAILHEPLKDSLVGDGNYKYVINYTNIKRNSGVINYYNKSTNYGNITFENNKITAVNIGDFNDFGSEKFEFHLYFNNKGELISEVEKNGFKAQRLVPITIIGDKYNALGSLQRLQTNHPKTVFKFFLDGNPYTTLEMRANKPYHGVMFEPDRFDNTYKYRSFNNGNKEEDISGLSKIELMQKLGF